jgi:tetratricopeptide (TPR) repeat protein
MRFLLDRHDTEAALALAGGLSNYMLAWGIGVDQRFLREGRDFLEQALSLSAQSYSPARLFALSLFGGILGELGEFERGAAVCRAALAEARSRAEARSILVCIWMYSRLLITWDNLPAARIADEEALVLSRAVAADPVNQWNDPLMLTLTLRRLGYVALWQGRYAQAREKFTEAMSLSISHGEQYLLPWVR